MPQLSSQQVLYEDNHLLVVNKQAGIATMGAEEGKPTMARLAAAYLKHKYNKPGNVFIGVVSRLDSRVSGVLLLARTSKAASRLSDQIRKRSPKKKYLAWAVALPDSDSVQTQADWIELKHSVCKNEKFQRMEVVEPGNRDSQDAVLRLRCLAAAGNNRLFEVELVTGRKHQIRVQLAELGYPIVGDTKYGSERKFTGNGIALHCSQLTISHPTTKEELTFSSPAMQSWASYPRDFEPFLQ